MNNQIYGNSGDVYVLRERLDEVNVCQETEIKMNEIEKKLDSIEERVDSLLQEAKDLNREVDILVARAKGAKV